MKASKVCKYAIAIGFGLAVGKDLGEFTKGFAIGIMKSLLSDKNKSESK